MVDLRLINLKITSAYRKKKKKRKKIKERRKIRINPKFVGVTDEIKIRSTNRESGAGNGPEPKKFRKKRDFRAKSRFTLSTFTGCSLPVLEKKPELF